MHARKLATIRGAVAILAGAGFTAIASGASASPHGTKVGNSKSCSQFTPGSINIGAFGPFSGPSASTGERGILPGLKVGVYEVNAYGGICGHKLNPIVQDSRGDPADAIPAAYQMIATNKLSAIIGLDSETAVSTARIFNQANLAVFTTAGAVQLNNLRMKYVYRTYPPDTAESYAEAASAIGRHLTRAVVVYDNTSGDQSGVAPLIDSYARHGGKVLKNITVAEDLPSYESDVQTIKQLKPNVIFYLTDVQTAGTFFAELQSAMGLKTKVIVGSTEPLEIQAIASSTHETNAQISRWMSGVVPLTAKVATYNSYVKFFAEANNGISPYNGYDAANFDGINIAALAMYMAKSSIPSKFIKYVEQITNDTKGKRCIDYGSCLKLLRKGKKIFYDGAAGPHVFNKFHWDTGQWAETTPGPTGAGIVTRRISNATLAKFAA